MLSRRSLLGGSLLAASSCRKPGGYAALAFVANQEGRAVAVVDLAALALVRHVHLDADPISVHTRQTHPAVFAVTPGSASIHEIHPESLAVTRRAKLGSEPSQARFQPGVNALWVLCSGNRQLVRVPLDSMKPDFRINLPKPAVDFDMAPPDGDSTGLCVVSFGTSGEFGILRLSTGRIERMVPLDTAIGKVRFARKDGRLIMAAELAERRLAVFDVPKSRLTVRLPLAVRPENFCFNADRGQLFISGEGMDAVVVVYTYQTEIGSTILAGHAPGFLVTSTEPDYLFVANPGSASVTIISIRQHRVMAAATVGTEPCHISITPGSEYALVLNRQSGDMAVLHVRTLTAQKTKSVPILTMVPVGSRPVSAVVRSV